MCHLPQQHQELYIQMYQYIQANVHYYIISICIGMFLDNGFHEIIVGTSFLIVTQTVIILK